MKYLFANWKKNLSLEQSVELTKELSAFMLPADLTLALFPDGTAFHAVHDAIRPPLVLGTQDLDELHGIEGAYVIVGHSSRRSMGDTDEAVAGKMQRIVAAGHIPVLCVGETKEERVEGKQEEHIRKQLCSALCDAAPHEFFIAYEPIYAIGTGENAPAFNVAETAGFIDGVLNGLMPGSKRHILYGGSVNAENVADYTHLPLIEGVLVGSASTTSDSLQKVLAAIS